jgi:hypothetical protein
MVQTFVCRILDSREGRPTEILSLCGGKGLEVLGALAVHPAKHLVTTRLVELHPVLGDEARRTARAIGVSGFEVIVGDAGMTDVYLGSVPADLVLVSGVLGNISEADVRATIGIMPQLCASEGFVIWTRDRRDPDLTPTIRRWFAREGFVEHAFVSGGPLGPFAVGLHRLEAPSRALTLGKRFFTFAD